MKTANATTPPHQNSPNGRWTKLRKDTVAGLINAAVSVPDGLASAALAGVNPIFGLYTSVAAAICGSLLVSAQLMQIATTSASALVAGQAIASYPVALRNQALFLLVALAGILLAIFGILRLGRLARFVSHAVMTGFLIGVAAVLILDQLAPLVGISPKGSNEVRQFFDLLSQIRRIDPATVFTGLLAITIATFLNRTKFAALASVAALALPSLLVAIAGWESVQRVADVSPIPRGMPALSLPAFELISPSLLMSAFALAVIIAVQGIGVSQTVENPDGTPVNASRDMVAQGAANFVSGLMSGIPAGGSVGQTALNISVGARSRWAGVLSGVWMLVFLSLAPGMISQVPMAVLAALMILAGMSAIDRREISSIWNTGGAARAAIIVTLIATLILPIPLAVGTGVLLTTALFVFSSATDVRVRALVRNDDGRIVENDPPVSLAEKSVTGLNVYGSLFFAGARTLADKLPLVGDTDRPVVVLRLRGRTRVGATLIEVLDDYADSLADKNGRLYLSGVDPDVARQLRSARKLDFDGSVHLFPEQPALGSATEEAITSAHEWLSSAQHLHPRNKQTL